jgi:hypothetical protein
MRLSSPPRLAAEAGDVAGAADAAMWSMLLSGAGDDFSLVTKSVAAFDQFFQTLRKARSRCAVNNIMIKADSDAQILTHGDLMVDDAWTLGDTTQG